MSASCADARTLLAAISVSSPNQTSGCLTQPHPPGKQFGWPRLAAWSLGAGICATVGANLAHGVGMGRSGRWSAPGPHWHWSARSDCC
jgi:hypothetical protein